MNLIIGNTSIKIWIPLFHIRQNGVADKYYILIFVIYFALLLTAAFATYQWVRIFWTIRRFHHNMTILCCFAFGSWFEVFAGVLITWPYKFGLISVNDTGTSFDGFVTEEMTIIEYIPSSLPLLTGSFMIWHYLGTCVAGMTIFTLERAVASFFFSDYEKHKRTFIAIILLVFSQFIVIMIVTSLFFYVINLKIAIVLGGFFLFFVIMAFIFLYYYNVRLRNKLDMKYVGLSYSLAARFQAAENARSFKLATNVVLMVTVITFFALLLLIAIQTQIAPPEYNYILVWVFETVVTLNPLFIGPTSIHTIPEWRDEFYRHLPFLQNRVRPQMKRIHRRRISKETDLYFSQLKLSWT